MRIGWSFLAAIIIKFCYDRRVFLLPLPFLFIVHEKLMRSFSFCYKHQRVLLHSSMIFAGASDEAFLLEPAPQMHPGFFATSGIIFCYNRHRCLMEPVNCRLRPSGVQQDATTVSPFCYDRQRKMLQRAILFAGTSQSPELHPWRAGDEGGIHPWRARGAAKLHRKCGRRSCIQGVRDTLRCIWRVAPTTRTAGEGANRRRGRRGGSSSLVAGGWRGVEHRCGRCTFFPRE
uniref:Uncharacterized protein n=1 Tax=Aegilops tauschii subsp. strangulata TaxID=200361 RepID=A0A453EHZ1_AEGTS